MNNGGPVSTKSRKHHPPPISIEDIKQPTLSYNDEEVDIAMENYLKKHQFWLPESVDAWKNGSTTGGLHDLCWMYCTYLQPGHIFTPRPKRSPKGHANHSSQEIWDSVN
jgi:hypothetical protein